MCGLVGLVTNHMYGGFSKETDIFAETLYYDAMRGMDSTGIAIMFADGGAQLLKEASVAWNFINTKVFDEAMKAFVKEGKAIIGHNRKKTVGEVKDDTAHPWLIDNRYLFIHNGTLHSHKHLADTEVDSEALGIVLTKCNGDLETLATTLQKVYGAYACAWIDRELKKLYLLRNNQRPLYLAKTESGWMFCSEPGFMKLATIRNGNKMETVESVPEDTLVTLDLSCNPVTMTQEKLPKKAMATQITTPLVGQKSHGGTDTLSKNEFKRMARQGVLIGRKIEFYAEDYIEREPGKKYTKEWKLWGVSDDVKFPHQIHAYLIDTDDWQLIMDIDADVKYEGKVESMSYDVKEKRVNIYVGIAYAKTSVSIQ